jgi:serine/threonine protein kinase
MGRMWRAYDQRLQRVVAVQEAMLSQLHGKDRETTIRRISREAQAAAHLRHPNVAVFHDILEQDDELWLVMEFIPGQSLMTEIADNGRLPWRRVAEIGVQVADALAYAHAAGMVHRNLNPGSVLVSGDRAVITGFGVAQFFVVEKLTGAGGASGAAEYTPPEELTGIGSGVSGDMWALGAILYTAVEGRPPFSGVSVLRDIRTLPPAPPEHAGPLSGLLAALLAKNPADRPDAKATTRALAGHAALQAGVQQASGDDLEPSGPPSPAPFTININQPIISSFEGNAVQNIEGTVNLGTRAEELLEIISRYGGSQAPALKTAVYEIENQSARPEVRKAARNRLIGFLRQLGQGAQQVAVDVLEKYIEARIGG